MSQHDNGRRAAGHPGEPWQQGHQGRPDYATGQQDQSANWRQGGQQGGQHSQYDEGRQQHGDNWRDQGAAPRSTQRRGPDEHPAYSGGQGSFGGQASDNDYGNRGITESGNYGNYDQGGQRSQRFGQYRQGYDARSDSTGGHGNFGPDGNNGGRDWNQGYPGNQGYGQSAVDRNQGYGRQRDWQQHAPSNQGGYGDDGYQGNWQRGQGGGQSYHDPDYHQWRSEQVSQLDRDYDEWRQHRYQRFSDEFNDWRSNRNRGAQQGQGGGNAQPSASAEGGKSSETGSAKSHK